MVWYGLIKYGTVCYGLVTEHIRVYFSLHSCKIFFPSSKSTIRYRMMCCVLKYFTPWQQLLNFSPTNMAWKARYLAEETQMSAVDLRSVLRRCPSLFAYSVERNLVGVSDFVIFSPVFMFQVLYLFSFYYYSSKTRSYARSKT